jgi:hypothetical protein
MAILGPDNVPQEQVVTGIPDKVGRMFLHNASEPPYNPAIALKTEQPPNAHRRRTRLKRKEPD